MEQLEINVWNDDVNAGKAFFTRSRGKVTTTFVYNADYIAGNNVPIDPEFPLVAGVQYVPRLPGSFSDAAPDRWGRNLLEKHESESARQEKRRPRTLDDVDYLLGVSDDTRQGALRFQNVRGDFLGANASVPPLVDLPKLMNATRTIAHTEAREAVKYLLQTGTTGLGGARPKAAVRLSDSSLALAKFPHDADSWDVMAWEATALDLLAQCGIDVPQYQLPTIGEKHVLVLKRFDRHGSQRLGYISMMTALRAAGGEPKDYMDVSTAIRNLSTKPRDDLHQLFRRVTAYIALGNTDDHLRNLGFVWRGQGWRLCPAFDVNPNPHFQAHRATTILGSASLDEEAHALLDFAEMCDLDVNTAKKLIRAVCDAIESWDSAAALRGISESERKTFSENFTTRLNTLREVSQ
ncbi:MAG: type II toxin-antitoxin system HipA family toxin [Actinomycetaceae bacterium]|nr:type II toxin-antitoxin system HipA family toxin [Actinomycetaceae bacterium]